MEVFTIGRPAAPHRRRYTCGADEGRNGAVGRRERSAEQSGPGRDTVGWDFRRSTERIVRVQPHTERTQLRALHIDLARVRERDRRL